ncbi:MAG: NgoPII family restriction endonuclease [Oscillospiraceae bacterium]|jgi:hypothetical protein|nr:NgoPII family restriction endonuclease [Oscillospiraceae bacterium]
MSVNVLNAIKNIISYPVSELGAFYEGRNRANSMGSALENYIADVFANTLNETNEEKRLELQAQTFSYIGNQNNPPDMIIRNGDAIEVKKIESKNSALALNSSYPKAKLFSDSTMITAACRTCEDWNEKDILYSIGVAKGSRLMKLFFVYGVDYAASAEVYERIKSVISKGINTIPDVEFAETNELGRINRVDPLGITYLRVRGMWGIENPAKVFSYIYTPVEADFELVAIINLDKYNSLPSPDRKALENSSEPDLKLEDVKIKIPDNPSQLKQAKLITFHR